MCKKCVYLYFVMCTIAPREILKNIFYLGDFNATNIRDRFCTIFCVKDNLNTKDCTKAI